MTSKRPPGFIVILALGLALVLGSGFYQPARAASEDVAMFYDDLSQYGQWVDYENYGPVWRPSNVDDQWRPYTDGRWTPTDDGYVFESQEPWGWATYHYGNWMPTEGYGWVWSPGRTWYPSTVEWRTSPETAEVDTSYVGWAPVPPPDYVPTQSYAATGVLSGGPGRGYPLLAVLGLRPGGQLPAGPGPAVRPGLFLRRLRLYGAAGLRAGFLPPDGLRAQLLYAELLPPYLFRQGFRRRL